MLETPPHRTVGHDDVSQTNACFRRDRCCIDSAGAGILGRGCDGHPGGGRAARRLRQRHLHGPHWGLVARSVACLALPLQAAMIGDGWPDAVNAQVLGDTVASTSVGKAWLGQLLGAGILAVVQSLPPRLAPKATAAASGLALATLALGGHADRTIETVQ